MKVYKSRYGKLPGTSYKELLKHARKEYHAIERGTRRQPYVKSAYFKKDKIFINQFWKHLEQKRLVDRTRRLRFYRCALDLLQRSSMPPVSKPSPTKSGQIVHRFAGITRDNELFFVQVRENKNTGRKDFMSVFPIENLGK